MGELSAFFRQNAASVENIRYAVSDRFTGKDGEAVMWELRALTPAEDEVLRRSSLVRDCVSGRPGRELDYNLYFGRLAAACTVFPDLNNIELQGSYGVMGADSLLKVMLTPGEYSAFLIKIQELNGFRTSFGQLEDTAKN